MAITKHKGEKKGKHSFVLNNGSGNRAGKGTGSVAWGYGLISTRDEQGVFGRFNMPDDDAIFIVGNGTSDDNRSNAIVVKENGNVLTHGGEIYAEINGICTPVLADIRNRLQKIYMDDGE